GGRDDQDRKVHQRPDGADLVLAQPRTLETPGDIAVQGQRSLKRWRSGDVLADQSVVPGIAGDDGAVAVNHRNRGVAVQRQRADEILEMAGLDTPARKADDLAVAA